MRSGSGTGGKGIGFGDSIYDTGTGFVEEYVLEDLELSPADLGD